jgi:hypothetical protein
VSKETNVLNNLFGKKKKHKEIQTSTSEMEFLGELEGNGVDALRFEIGKILKQFPHVKNAYLSRLKYRGEDKQRISLVIESSESSSEVGPEVANQCAGIIPMDIIFSDSCTPNVIQEIRLNSAPLFVESNLLFECPIVVSRGTNTDMPAEWKGAILYYFVAAQEYEAALIKAATDLKSDGYKFETVYDGKVNQIDPTVWWDQYVMEKWPEYADHFPSQEDMEIILITGGLHKGPALGWEIETSNT